MWVSCEIPHEKATPLPGYYSFIYCSFGRFHVKKRRKKSYEKVTYDDLCITFLVTRKGLNFLFLMKNVFFSNPNFVEASLYILGILRHLKYFSNFHFFYMHEF